MLVDGGKCGGCLVSIPLRPIISLLLPLTRNRSMSEGSEAGRDALTGPAQPVILAQVASHPSARY